MENVKETREEIEQTTKGKSSFDHAFQVISRIEGDLAIIETRYDIGIANITGFKNKLRQLERQCYAYKWSRNYSAMKGLLEDLCPLQATVNDYVVRGRHARAMREHQRAKRQQLNESVVDMEPVFSKIEML